MIRFRCSIVLALAAAASAQSAPPEVPPALDSVQMLDCSPISAFPCFRGVLSFNNAVRAVPDNLLRANTVVEFDSRRITPFYVSLQDAAASGRKPRTALVLLDISGSMTARMSNGAPRIDVAKQAVERFVTGLDPDVDQVAVVPFDNHGVTNGIRRARFVAGGDGARSLLAAIPNPRGDTALYAAVYYGIDTLEQRQRLDPSREYQLITITDGVNDLGRDADPELRTHPITLDTVARKADRSTVGVYLIGIGGGENDTGMLSDLEAISIRHAHTVLEPEVLIDILSETRPAVTKRVVFTFLSPYNTTGQLQGRNHLVRVTVGRGAQPITASATWAPPEAMIAPQAREDCAPVEREALIRFGPPGEYYTALIRPLATGAVFACILALCWFLMPRLIWPEEYTAPLQAVDAAPRWSVGRQPPGAKAASAPGGRQETDETHVLPRQDSTSRSRFK